MENVIIKSEHPKKGTLYVVGLTCFGFPMYTTHKREAKRFTIQEAEKAVFAWNSAMKQCAAYNGTTLKTGELNTMETI